MRFTWKKTLLAAALACGVSPGVATAQQYSGGPAASQQFPGGQASDDLRARLDAYEAELQALRQQVQANNVYQTAAFETNAELLDGKDAAKKDGDKKDAGKKDGDKKDGDKKEAKADEPKCCEVGSNLDMKVRWNPANGITFETPCKDFVSHIGVRFQWDIVSFNQHPDPAPALGHLEEGTYFRRIRPSWDGTAYGVMEWNVELALEQVQNNIPNLDNCWVGMKDIPIINTVRLGHMHLNQGLEGDMTASSKAMTFMERSMYTDAFYENLGTGIMLANHIADDHITWQSSVYRQDNVTNANSNNTGADFNAHGWAWTGRVTALPFYQDEGRHMLHLGSSLTYRQAENVVNGGPGVTQFRARPELRDTIGAAPFGNGNRLVLTAPIQDADNTVLGLEFFYVLGRLSLQSEYAWAYMDHANGANVTAAAQNTNLGFDGGYLQASYFLTGENRIYDRRFGTLGADYITAPYTPFWCVRTADCDTCMGWGAWELAARYSYLNLNNPGLVRAAEGGRSEALELGVNWYLNTNLKLQFEYLHQNAIGGPSNDTKVDGFGMRTQFFF